MTALVILLHVFVSFVAALLNAAETSLLMLPVSRIRRIADTSGTRAASLEHLVETRHRLRATAAFSSGSAGGLGMLSGGALLPMAVLGSDVLIDGISSPVDGALFVLGAAVGLLITHSLANALPRTLAVANPDKVAMALSGFADASVLVSYPVIGALGGPWRGIVRLLGADRSVSAWAVSPDWHSLESDDEGGREETEEALLEAVSVFAGKVVREVMVPRTDVKAVEDTATLAQVMDVIETYGLSRIPVYHETVDDIRGVLFAKDLIRAVVEDRDVVPATLAREPFFVPETKPIDELLVAMRSTTHIAIVADEYGGTAGIVTLEDLLEEIVGDISDEYDEEEQLVVSLGDGRYQVDARLPIDDLDDLLGTHFETDADSVGGLYTEITGSIPEQGERVDVDGVRLTVTDMDGNRLRHLLIEPIVRDDEGESDA